MTILRTAAFALAIAGSTRAVAYQEVATIDQTSHTAGSTSSEATQACMDLDFNYAHGLASNSQNVTLADRCSKSRTGCLTASRYLLETGKEVPKPVLDCGKAQVQVADLVLVKVVYPGGVTKDYGIMSPDQAASVTKYYNGLNQGHSVQILPRGQWD